MEKKKEKMVTPFSNGTSAMIWEENNCSRCVKAFHPAKGKEYPDFTTTQKLVNLGRECKLKYHLDMGHVLGEIPFSIAEQIGMEYYNEQENGNFCKLKSCMMFSDNKDDGFKSTPRKPYEPPRNQLTMPFIIEEIEQKTLEQKILV